MSKKKENKNKKKLPLAFPVYNTTISVQKVYFLYVHPQLYSDSPGIILIKRFTEKSHPESIYISLINFVGYKLPLMHVILHCTHGLA